MNRVALSRLYQAEVQITKMKESGPGIFLFCFIRYCKTFNLPWCYYSKSKQLWGLHKLSSFISFLSCQLTLVYATHIKILEIENESRRTIRSLQLSSDESMKRIIEMEVML